MTVCLTATCARDGPANRTEPIYFITTVLAERGRGYFADFQCARCVANEMRTMHNAGMVHSLAWVVMPDHVHWLFQLGERLELSLAVKCFKARSAHRVNEYLNRRGRLWQKAFYDHAVRNEEELQDIGRYIVANTLRAGLVKNIGDYPHWDAVWL